MTPVTPARLTRLAGRSWWQPSAVLLIAAAALGIALLVPRLFSDPVGVDPFVLRLSGVATALAAASLAWGRLNASRPILLALAAMTVSFSVFAGGPQWIEDISGTRLDFNTQVLVASAAEALLTIALAVLAVRLSPARLRPLLRLRRLGVSAQFAAVAGTLAFLLIVMLLPATLLGRQGIAPIALARDLPLQGPADVLQGFAQELQFRGLLLGTLDRVAPPWAANLGQAAFFGVAHIAVQYQGPADAFVPVTVALGWLFGWVTQKTGSLWPAIIIHGIADVAVTAGVIPGLYGY
ncbi:MAG TPA: CPBP family intramembrane glutamic endopeptidase [Candidatus Dormibacteraeota bacterium]|nr:CPBP family intramembrane glutamic endopeptidase [Candidatus Dormibacteraeota bacterium]